ncbi:MAG: hypothetical protein KAS32_07130 [Candidatus Peribacteraceae bacterium]|nr:hypothetical protein [Candidatus Peribacteraceae bacterium]
MKDIKKRDIQELEQIRANMIILFAEAKRILNKNGPIRNHSRQWEQMLEVSMSSKGGLGSTIELMEATLKEQEADEEDAEAEAAAEEDND